MIQLSGPEAARSGTRVCVTASNAGAGFSVVAQIGKKEIPTKVSIDPRTHVATICFDMPAVDTGGVTIHAGDGNGGRDSLVVLAL